MLAFRAAAMHLDRMQREGFLSEHAWEVLRPELLERVDRLALDVRALQRVHPELAVKELDTARRELLRAQRSALRGLQRDGAISEEVFEALVTEIDAGLDDQDTSAPARPTEQEHTTISPDRNTATRRLIDPSNRRQHSRLPHGLRSFSCSIILHELYTIEQQILRLMLSAADISILA